jgi:hypothetical protein
MGRISTKEPQKWFFFRRCSLSRIAVFSKTVIVQKVIEPEPLIGQRQVNTRWKSSGVLYLFYIQHLVEFQIEQHQISIYWLLLAVKAEWASLSYFSCLEVMLLD